MAETYQILLIEKDKQVADDVRRFLRASAGGAGFSLEYGEDLAHGQSMVASSRPDLVIVDAEYIDKAGTFENMKLLLHAQHIPLLLLSATNGQDLRSKAATAGAADYLLKNKLNYFYLPRVILSAIRAQTQSAGRSQSTDAHMLLLDRMSEAVMIADGQGEVIYSNNAGRQLLEDSEVLDILRRFIDLKNNSREIKASIAVQAASYELRIAPQDWQGEPCISIHLSKNGAQSRFTLDDKVKLLNEFIQSCSIPFVLLVDGYISHQNDSFLAMLRTDRQTLDGRPLEEFVSTDRGRGINLHEAPKPDAIRAIMGANLSAPLALLRKTVASGEHNITICSIVTPGQEDNQLLNPHRLMEIASHDLREPVRTSVSYLQLLTDGLRKEGGDKKLLGYAETIGSEMSRAERMLADMRMLMNLKDKNIKPEKLNMLTLIQDTLKELKPLIDASDAMVNVSEMPSVRADRDDIKRLLFHLTDNALKFRKSDKRPYVEILSARQGREWQFCIRDNGIGIDAKYHTAIFEPFRKLNRVDEYPGAGNGLCISKHIVEMHGGRIWVESHEGFGSSFFFTLPAE